jgi:phospholipase/carboxylesterase
MDERELDIAGLPTIAVGDLDAPPFVFVLLHGFAMLPGDLSPFAHSLGLRGLFLLPRGPYSARITPTETRAHAWWDLDPVARAAALARGPRDFAGEHPPELPRSRARLGAFLDEVRARFGGTSSNTPAGRVPLFLGGFSQGGMLACDTFLRDPRPLAGLVLLSASRIAFDEWTALSPAAPSPFANPPPASPRVFVSHGQTDADLAFATGVALRDHLVSLGADMTWVPFEQGHEIPLVAWRALRKFIASTHKSGQ